MLTDRRSFIKSSSAIIGAAMAGNTVFMALASSQAKSYKAAIIGRTGRGDYGHGFDVVLGNLDNVRVLAVADENPDGLKKAAERSGAQRKYPDYRQMLEKEKPDIVSIGPRQPDCHRDMALAAIEAGASIYLEKPMTESVEDADAIVHAAENRGVKVAVGHTRRFDAEFALVRNLLRDGFVGDVLEFRVQGKQDSRVGGEDLIVLGTHDFDIMRYYFGDPLWCSASVTEGGQDITVKNARKGHEPILVAGDTVRAMFALPKNVQAYWSSVKTDDHWNTQVSALDKWGFVISGTKRTIAYQSSFGFAYLDSPFLARKDAAAAWRALPKPADWVMPDYERHPVKSLIHAIETGNQPLCSGYDGRWTIEMVSSIYQSQFSKSRISFPLKNRKNPLLSIG